MFGNIGFGELAVLFVVGMFLFGPEKLPRMAGELGRSLRQLRQMANGMTAEIKSELGPEFADLDLKTLNPRAFVQKHLFDDADDDVPPGHRPTSGPGTVRRATGSVAPGLGTGTPVALTKPQAHSAVSAQTGVEGSPTRVTGAPARYDLDAT